MLFFTLKTICIYLLLISLIHYLYKFFKNTLTTPKVKDLVNTPTKKYNDMFANINSDNDYLPKPKIMSQQNTSQSNTSQQNTSQQNTSQSNTSQSNTSQSNTSQQNMQMELVNFLNELKKTDANNMGANNMGANNMGANNMGANNPLNIFPTANESAFKSYN